MDDIEDKLAKKGEMIDFNQPPIIEKADGNMKEVSIYQNISQKYSDI